ncbi:hypothetical protein HMI57_09170 [Arthrobacter sp. 260]|nr:hypothetical protein [Arthrobacter sp. 260]
MGPKTPPGRTPRGRRWSWGGARHTALLLLGGSTGATVLTLLHIPAGALIGAVLGAMVVNGLGDRRVARSARWPSTVERIRGLPGPVRVTGQALLGVMAGARLSLETLQSLAVSALPVTLSVVLLLGLTMVLARYLFSRHRVDPLTAVMAAAPGGISELSVAAAKQGAAMHVVLTVHLFRVLVVVLVVLPILIFVIGH